MTSARTIPAILSLAVLSGCASPTYIDKAEGESGWLGINEVTFQVHDGFKKSPPDCIAILPLTIKTPSQPMASPDESAKVRLSLYAHLASHSVRGVRLERVDHVQRLVNGDLKALATQLNCGAVISGEITEYGTTFLALYSRVAVGVDLKMIRPMDGAVLWEGRHTAASHGGSVPIDPVGIAMGVLDAVNNVGPEQILRVTDDLARRLVSTIPDSQVMALEDPVPEKPVPPSASLSSDEMEVAEKLLSAGDHAGAMAAANRLLAADANRADAWFLKGRVLMLDRDYAAAEPAMLRAAALDRSNHRYLNGLGAVNAARGTSDRALAAYELAIGANSANGFAWYNTAVIHFNAGNLPEASEAFYAAGLAYLKTGDYAMAERSLGDLKEISKSGIQIQSKIKIIEDTLSDISRRTS
jgi:hypothetical protein